MKWIRLPIKEFDGFASEWDRVSAYSVPRAPFMRSIFIRPLLREFGTGNETIVVGHDGGNPRVVAIVQKVRPGMWQTFQPSQLPLGAIAFQQGVDFGAAFEGLISATPGLSLSLGLTQLDPHLVPRPEPHARLRTLDYIDTAWVEVTGTFEAYWDGRGKNLRHNIRKQRSKLDEQGIALRLETLIHPREVTEVLRDYGTLESA